MAQKEGDTEVPAIAQAAVLAPVSGDVSAFINEKSIEVKGPDFSLGKNLPEVEVLRSLMSTGFQATHLAQAAAEIDRMRTWRLSHVPVSQETDDDFKDIAIRESTKCTIFLSYTSNMISSGVREVIKFLVEHKMVDALVTTAGGIEEDFIKCLAPCYVGDFSHRGKELRPLGVNRIGNLLIPNENYCKFESWLLPILHKLADEQDSKHEVWTPSKLIRRLGLEMNDESSVYYWAAKNNIPVFCPAITDGSIGDMLYFFSYKRQFVLDIVQDVRAINDLAVHAKASGMIILGGGLVKHHVCNANLMRNGADFAVFINTGQEFDGSDSGARPDEAVSWGKIKMQAKPVKVYADASLAFPLLVAMTFAKDFSP